MSEVNASTLARLALRFAVALGILLGVEALAHLPLGAPARGSAIPLAIRTGAGKIEICRDVPAAELAKLPIHMRQPRLCTEPPEAYRLTLAVDGREIHATQARRRGMRSDRPLVIDELVEIPAGQRAIAVSLEPDVPPGTPETTAAQLPRGELRRTLDLPAGRIALVTWESGSGLVVRQ